jgi:hypothetical protein
MMLRLRPEIFTLSVTLLIGLSLGRPVWALSNETYSTSGMLPVTSEVPMATPTPVPAPAAPQVNPARPATSVAVPGVATNPPVAAPAAIQGSECWGKVGDKCTLMTPYTGMHISVGPKKEVLADLGDNANPNSQEASLHLSEDLRHRVNRGEMTEEEAGSILDELARFDGAAYSIPTVEQLKIALNLPKESLLSSEEYRELVRVHMQITLSVGAATASYLSDRMGVEVGDENDAANATKSNNPGDDDGDEPPDSPELPH